MPPGGRRPRSTSCTGSRGRPAGRRSSPSPSRAPPPGARARRARRSCCRGGSRRARSSPGRDSGMFCASHAPTLLDGRDLARLVQLPQAREAPQLALQVAGRLAEALQPGRAPVDRVDLDERVDQLLGRSAARSAGVSSAVGDARRRSPRPRPAPSRRTGAPITLSSSHTASTAGTRAGVRCSAASRRASRSTSWALGGSGGRGGRRSTTSRRRARSGRSRWSDPRRSARPRSRPRRARARRGTPRSGSSTSRGARSLALPPPLGLDDVVGCDRRAHGQRSHRRQLRDRNLALRSRCLKPPCPDSASSSSAPCSSRPRRCSALARRAGARLHSPDHLLRGLRATCSTPRTRPHAIAQLQHLGVQSAARGARLGRRRAAAPRAPRKPAFEATNPGSYAWGEYDALIAEATAAALEGAADDHLAGAALGDVEQESAIRHAGPTPRTSRNS